MSFRQKWFERAIILTLITVGWVTHLYVISIIGVIWLIDAI